MLDILIALLFVGMVACPALLNALSVQESEEASGNTGRALIPALANAKESHAGVSALSSR